MIQTVVSSYLQHQQRILSPYVSHTTSVLDFGCGDMELDRALLSNHPSLTITGVDVVPFRTPLQTRLKFRLYTGHTLPFRDCSFDTVFSYHVLHHTDDPSFSLQECVRVSSRRIILVEPVLRHPLEIIGFRFMDFVTNIWKPEHIPLPYHVHTRLFWKQECKKYPLRSVKIRHVGLLPRFLPIGETLLFVLEKRV